MSNPEGRWRIRELGGRIGSRLGPEPDPMNP